MGHKSFGGQVPRVWGCEKTWAGWLGWTSWVGPAVRTAATSSSQTPMRRVLWVARASIPGHWHFISHASMIPVEIQAGIPRCSWWTKAAFGDIFWVGSWNDSSNHILGHLVFEELSGWALQQGIFTRDLSRYMANNWLPSDQLNPIEQCSTLLLVDVFFWIILFQFHGWPCGSSADATLLGSNLGSTVWKTSISNRQARKCRCRPDKKIAATYDEKHVDKDQTSEVT